MIARQPVIDGGQLVEIVLQSLVGGACATIRQVSGTQQQINDRALFLNQIDDGLQRVVGIHAQQSASAQTTEVRIGQLHKLNGLILGVDGFEGVSGLGHSGAAALGIGHGRGDNIKRGTPVLQTVFQPVCQKSILLGLFILRKHLIIRVLVSGRHLTIRLKGSDLQHTSVMIGPHFDI